MSAFDTSTNTASVSFTNAYATAVLQPSATTQYAYGFRRSTGWRYFEFYVDDAGGSPENLWVGVWGAGGPADTGVLGTLWGSSSQQVEWVANNFYASSTVSDAFSMNISTGDTWQFAVDFGGGRDHAGVQRQATMTDGFGNLMLPVYVEVGRNNVWGLYGYNSWVYARFGYSGFKTPVVARGGTSLSSATVSLRVQTTSFVYAIPSGMVAWADGPEGGGTSTLTDASVYWDPLMKSAQLSLSSSNQYLVFKHSYTYTGTVASDFWYTTSLPSTGKRVIEMINRGATATRAIGPIGFGLADSDISITASITNSVKKIGRVRSYSSFYERSVLKTASITMSNEGYDVYGETPGQMMFIDFDAGRFWHTGGLITGGGARRDAFSGDKAATVCDPYLGNDGLTFTNSVGVRVYMEHRRDSTVSAQSVYLNVGQGAFETFPQLPGWISMDGGRRVYGVGSKWDTTTFHGGSTTFYASDLAVRTSVNNLFLSTGAKFAGKKYFEIFKQHQQDNQDYVGVYYADATTQSATSAGLVMDQGLFFSTQNKLKARYGTTTTFTPTSSAISGGSSQNRWGVAVDFDLGHIWCGVWNRNDRQMNWTPGADPAAGTQPDFTFTASTTFKIAMIMGGAASGGAKIGILVAEDTNVIGKPTGFDTWNGTTSVTASATMTPSSAIIGGGNRVLWPYGVQT